MRSAERKQRIGTGNIPENILLQSALFKVNILPQSALNRFLFSCLPTISKDDKSIREIIK